MRLVSTLLLFIIALLLGIYIVPQTKFYQDVRHEQNVREAERLMAELGLFDDTLDAGLRRRIAETQGIDDLEALRQMARAKRSGNATLPTADSPEARAQAEGYCGTAGCSDPDTGRRIINDRVLTSEEDEVYGRCESDLYDKIVTQQKRSLSEYRTATYDCSQVDKMAEVVANDA